MYFKNIPDEMKSINNWVGWRLEERDGKPTKVPINPTTLGNAITTNSSTWGSFEQALSGVGHKYTGIGFVFDGTGLVGVDIDDCRDPETGSLTPEAQEIIHILDSYTEISQSGKGIHIICRGKLPKGGRRKEPVEMYETGRYFVMTGNVLDDGHMHIEERTEQLAMIHEKYINVKPLKNTQKRNKTVHKTYETEHFFYDDEIIEKARNAKNGALFSDLMSGNWEGKYTSQSEADMALCNMLAFWTKDAGTIDRIFRRSGLYRRKWDEKRGERTYGEITIQEALATVSDTYEPKRKNKDTFSIPDIDLGYDQLYGKPVEGPIESKLEYKDTTSDLGRSKIFSEKYKGILRWCGDMKTWLVWNGKYWERDRILQVMQMAKKTVDEMIFAASRAMSKAIGEDEVKKAKQAFKDTIKAKSERCIKSMVELAKSDLPITANQLDEDPFLLNCQNGVVDLRTGELKPHDPELYMTKITNANYEPGKKFEKFGKFLKDVTCNDDALAEYFQQICGMVAVGKVFYEGIVIFFGNGRNGKSTFLNCISRVLGDYAGSIRPELLMYQKDGREVVGLAEVKGKRLITAIETEEGKRLSSVMLKQLSSTDPITAKRLYENPITFYPTHTLIMATNFLPRISSTDAGTWRRIAVVPFRAKFEGEQEVKDYASVLFEADADAILTWIVEGAVKYIRNGYDIKIPTVVEEATKEYRIAEDWLGNFIADCCEVGDGYEESGGDLYEAYKEWCNQNNESYVRRSRDFALQLEIQGYEKRRTMHGSIWAGLRLIDSKKPSTTQWSGSKNNNYRSALFDDDLDEMARKMM